MSQKLMPVTQRWILIQRAAPCWQQPYSSISVSIRLVELSRASEWNFGMSCMLLMFPVSGEDLDSQEHHIFWGSAFVIALLR